LLRRSMTSPLSICFKFWKFLCSTGCSSIFCRHLFTCLHRLHLNIYLFAFNLCCSVLQDDARKKSWFTHECKQEAQETKTTKWRDSQIHTLKHLSQDMVHL
jgi:hypothetical protein